MNLRSTIVWFFVWMAVMNGALRNAVLTPRLGELAGHVASSVILCIALLVVTWLTIGWMQPANSRDAALIGVQWVLMTVAFEFLAGHYVFGAAWSSLFADYNVFAGRIWALVLVTSAFAPLLAARARAVLAG
jgi:hypothetical protein